MLNCVLYSHFVIFYILFFTGDKCNSCQPGFYGLNTNNPNGCSPCNCDPQGSTDPFCNPINGQCLCKEHFQSRNCGECSDGYYKSGGTCKLCGCSKLGTEDGTTCDRRTGQCRCKIHVTGLKCDVCKDGYFQVGSSPLEGCSACDCNSAGTLANSTICDKVVGNCTCKQNVEGRTCSECVSNTWNLTEANPQGKVI